MARDIVFNAFEECDVMNVIQMKADIIRVPAERYELVKRWLHKAKLDNVIVKKLSCKSETPDDILPQALKLRQEKDKKKQEEEIYKRKQLERKEYF